MAEPYKTVISSHAAFATADDLVEYRDWRQVADLLSDDDTRPGGGIGSKGACVAVVTDTSAGGRALRAASAEIEAACYRGGRYTRADLQRLLVDITDADGGPAKVVARELLIQLTCDIAFWILTKRKKPDADPRRVAGVLEAMAKLEALRLGEAVFPFYETTEAAHTDIAPLDPNVDKTNYRLTPLSQIGFRVFGVRGRSLSGWNW